MENQFNQVSQEVQSLLIKEYLKKHIELSEENLKFPCKNGKLVLDGIDTLFSQIGHRKNTKKSKEGDLLFHDIPIQELSADPEERYEACNLSIKNSKKLISSLFTTSEKDFSLKNKNHYLGQLTKLSRRCGEAIREILSSKKHIMNMMDSDEIEADTKTVHLQINDLLDGTLKLIENQHALLELEAELSNKYFDYSQGYIEKYFSSVKAHAKTNSLKTIATVYRYLVDKSKISLPNVHDFNFDVFQQYMDQFQDVMSKKRQAIENLSKVMQFMEVLMEELHKPVQTGSLPVEEKKGKGSSSGSRMSIMSRIGGRLFGFMKR